MSSYDVLVIGAGPGGYVAALRAGQLGLRTALIERDASLGGTCLNAGCIPSKALLDSSERWFELRHRLAAHGIRADGLELDWPQMQRRKDEVVKLTTRGIAELLRGAKVEILRGSGRLAGPGRVELRGEGTVQVHETANVVIATGSQPAALPGVAFDGERVIGSTEALALPAIPARLAVIGGGVIGLEIGSIYARLGSAVVVIEAMDSLLPGMDRDCARELQRVLRRDLGMEIRTSHRVAGVERAGDGVLLRTSGRAEVSASIEADRCLVAVGRRPFTGDLGLESVGLAPDARGFVPVDAELRCGPPGLWAVGDVVGGPMLAHKAEEEGIAVAERIAGQKPEFDRRLVPAAVYTAPELAAVGRTEEQLAQDGVPFKVGRFAFRASGRARASGEVDGLVKVLARQDDDEILGVHVLGPRASDLIAEAVIAMEFRASAEDLGRACHAHPTFSEALKEAALAASRGRALHS